MLIYFKVTYGGGKTFYLLIHFSDVYHIQPGARKVPHECQYHLTPCIIKSDPKSSLFRELQVV